MMGVRIWIFFLMVCGVLGAQESDIARKTDHNLEEYNALCNLMKISVQKWKELESRGNEGPLKKALGRTIFGDDRGGDLQNLKSETFQKVYKDVERNALSRLLWCGGPYDEDSRKRLTHEPRWPGHSVPHDLVCLCTVGPDGWPLNNNGKDKLCGLEGNALVATEKQGWGAGGPNSRGAKQIEATWKSITKTCLEGNASGNNLKDALGDFLRQLKKTPGNKYPERYQLGEGKSDDDYPCSGNEKICVMYHNSTEHKHPMPWWTELQGAIEKDDEIQAKKKSKEETSKQESAQKQRKTQNQEKPQLPQEPHTAPVKATKQDPTDIEQENTENLSTPIATLEEASSTLIITPCIWFLGVLLLI
ncbi:Variant surface glycoprotein [Trypanosoma congolense IL3000]|uniref:Variant surface glycoprotein n=1 Tax=Trypanosoma congolense (strain IL3000) TaxID=1068625 RepID=F9W9B5_TRYCI|nr:Variant surface glycoprotein [Trypanosoma congolense IL3000]